MRMDRIRTRAHIVIGTLLIYLANKKGWPRLSKVFTLILPWLLVIGLLDQTLPPVDKVKQDYAEWIQYSPYLLGVARCAWIIAMIICNCESWSTTAGTFSGLLEPNGSTLQIRLRIGKQRRITRLSGSTCPLLLQTVKMTVSFKCPCRCPIPASRSIWRTLTKRDWVALSVLKWACSQDQNKWRGWAV